MPARLTASIVCIAIALATVGSLRGLAQAPVDVAIAVHPDVPVDNLTLADVRRIVLGDREFWPGSLRLTLYMRAPVAHERDVILKTVCQMTEAQFRQHWIAKVFRADTAVAPKIVYSADTSIDLANRTPGAIAFVDAPVATRAMKIVRVDGKLPGEAGYPLRNR